MKKDERNKSFSIKWILALLIPVVIMLMFLFIKNDIVLNNKWTPISMVEKMNDSESLEMLYMYCANYNDIRSGKLITILFIIHLIILILTLSIIILYLFITINNEKIKIRKGIKFNFLTHKKNNNFIASRIINDEKELKVQQLLSSKLKEEIYNKFCDLQIACMDFDYDVLEKVLSKELYDKYIASLETLKSKSRKNVFNDFELLNAKFVDISEDDEKYSIKIKLKVSFYGYILDTNNNEIIKGSSEEKIIDSYELIMIKYKTDTAKNNDWIISEKEKIDEN